MLESLILKHDADAPPAGLDSIAPDERPPAADSVLGVPDHGGAGLRHAGPRRMEPCIARAQGRLYDLALAAPRRRG